MIITKTSSGFSAKFAFELKDAFKAAFPSAKWDSDERCWKVGVRSEKRLIQFAEEIKAAEQALEEADAVEIAGEKLVEIRDMIAKARKSAEAAAHAVGGLVAVKTLTAALSSELAEAKAQEEAELKALAEKQAEIAKRLHGVVSINQMIGLQETMAWNHDWKSRAKATNFKEAQKSAREIKKKLSELGLYSQGLNRLINMNINRPDRDRVRDITRNEFFMICEEEA